MSKHSVNIDPRVNQLLLSFKEYWSKYSSSHPSYYLDGTWLSLSVIDQLSFKYRISIPEMEDPEYHRFREIAAYLSIVLSNIWKEYGLEVKIEDLAESGISIQGKAPDFVVKFNLEDSLSNCLSNLSNSFPVLKDFIRPLAFESSIIPLFLIGPALGWSSECLFPANNDDNERKKIFSVFEKILARQYAEWFSKVRPDNALLQVPELYLQNLIFPLILNSKETPLYSSAIGASRYLKSLGFTKAQLKMIGRDLNYSGDEILSSYGTLLHIASCSYMDVPDKSVISSSKSKNYLLPLQFPSLSKVVEEFGISWQWLGNKLSSKEDIYCYELEKSIGMHPWCILPASDLKAYFKETWFESFFFLLLKFELFDAMKLIEAQLEEKPYDVNLRIQRIKLIMLSQDIEKAHDECKKLLSEPDADSNPIFFNQWGYVMLELAEPDIASRYFKAGIAVCKDNNILKSEIQNNLAWSYMCLGNLEEANPLLLESIKNSANPLTPMLNRMAILWEKRGIEELIELRKASINLAPFDRRVFASATLLPAI